MLRKIISAALAAAMLLCICGCSRMLEANRTIVTEHKDVSEGEQPDDITGIKTYAGLRMALLSMIENCAEHSTLLIDSYAADVSREMAHACLDVTRDTAIGSYAVDYMTHSYEKVGRYYEMKVYITYKHPAQDIFSIKGLRYLSEANELFFDMLRNGDTRQVIRLNTTILTEDYLRQLAADFYADFPDELLFIPEISVQEHSGGAMDKIIEINIDFGGFTAEQLNLRKTQLYSRVDAICAEVQGENERERLINLCNIGFTTNGGSNSQVQEIFADTAYGALCSGSSSSKARADALVLICRNLGIECSTVSGWKDGVEHVWNAVTLDGIECYVDSGRENLFVPTDDSGQFIGGYSLTPDESAA